MISRENNAVIPCAVQREAPGDGHERHYHAAHFGYVLESGKMRISDKSGAREVKTKAGDTWTSDGIGWREVLNIGKTKSVYVLVEPKGTNK